MSRSVSAPSSVTNTSPCWNGLIVPGSTFRYGSNFCSCTRRPRALRRRPSDAATIPFPSAETTPPVTKTYFGARALTGFQGSSGAGGGLRGGAASSAHERRQPGERLRGERAADADQAGRHDRERRQRLAVLDGLEGELGLEPLAAELEREPPQGLHLEHEERAAQLGPAQEARPGRALDLPERARSKRAPHGRHDPLDARPPLGEPLRLGEQGPDLLHRGRQRPSSDVPWQGTPARRASARARPSAPARRAARSGPASGRRPSSPRERAGRRAPRSAADA